MTIGEHHLQEILIGAARRRAVLIGADQAVEKVQAMTVGRKVTDTASITFRKGL